MAYDRTSLVVVAAGVAAGFLVANLYYAQPLIAQIAADLSVPPQLAGAFVGITQVGYGLGLFLVVPLSDTLENKGLILASLTVAVVAIGAIVGFRSPVSFLCASLALGLSCSAAQILIPFISHIVAADARNRVVGNVMGGILAGVTLARPVSLLLASVLGWRSAFIASAAFMAAIGTTLYLIMPVRHSNRNEPYLLLLTSMKTLLSKYPLVRRRAVYQALLFGAFSMFWGVAPVMLAERLELSSYQISLFALVGIGGVFAAPLTARFADAKSVYAGTLAGCFAMAIAFFLSIAAVQLRSVAVLLISAIVIDAAVHVNQTFGRLITLTVDSSVRGRVNSIYMTILFTGGAVGSFVGPAVYKAMGWDSVAMLGAGTATIVLLATGLDICREKRRRLADEDLAPSFKAMPSRISPPFSEASLDVASVGADTG
ncbi:MFS transporter [Bradyrhizobium sp. WSM3983]|uniref:MFS transporter n=1 Tax=Bradyrhizobium sp. WSM3983 TaxID=1038867 RepID=UPI000407D7EC|nr:MFS transporter [Bradyrhizobium sp. WSM3983]